GKGVDLNRSPIATDHLHRVAEVDAFSGNHTAGVCNLHCKSGDALDLRFVEIGAGGESPRIVHEDADAEALTVLVADTVDVAVLDAHYLLTPIDDADIGIASPLQLCDVQRVIDEILHEAILCYEPQRHRDTKAQRPLWFLTARNSLDNLAFRFSTLCMSKRCDPAYPRSPWLRRGQEMFSQAHV